MKGNERSTPPLLYWKAHRFIPGSMSGALEAITLTAGKNAGRGPVVMERVWTSGFRRGARMVRTTMFVRPG